MGHRVQSVPQAQIESFSEAPLKQNGDVWLDSSFRLGVGAMRAPKVSRCILPFLHHTGTPTSYKDEIPRADRGTTRNPPML